MIDEQKNMDSQPGEQELINAFHLMWDFFPEPSTLVHKSKRVVAVNPACAVIGREVGMICIKHGPPEAHAGCLANKALKSGEALYSRNMKETGESLIYWLPVKGEPDYYIHFGTRVILDYK